MADHAAAARVRAVLAVAARVADPRDPLGREARVALGRSSGLSAAGVELVLSEHLETCIEDDDLARLLAGARPTRCATVVLAANVCTAAVRAVACALGAAPVVRLRPSRRDPVLSRILARELGEVELVSDIEPTAGDQLHLYGSDEAIAAICEGLPRGVEVHRHGPGFGVALVGGSVDLGAAAGGVACDLVPFDGAGCLSPRLVLVDGEPERAAGFAAALHEALAGWARRVPRGPLAEDERGELARWQRTMQAVGLVHAHEHHLVAVDPAPEALSPAPPLRATLVGCCPRDRLAALLAPWPHLVTALGAAVGDDLLATAQALCPAARTAALGRMQHPPLDGPVDRRPRVSRVTGA